MISEDFIPDKPFKTYEELLELLADRNVTIEDNTFTIDCLSDYSYYDLINGYKNLYPVDKDDKFLIPVPFSEFYLLHNFDIALNNVILKYILLVEKSFKSKLSYIISHNYGVQTDLEDTSNVNKSDYLCRDYYIKPKMRNNILKSIKVKALERKDTLSVKHYLEHHNHLPFWILINSIPLGLAIKWYSILGSNEKQYITEKLIKSEELSIEEKKEFLKNALDILKQYRNNIAHGHKIFSSSIKEQLPKKQTLLLSNSMITKADYNKGFGKNDIIAITIILSVLLSKDMRILFINEIHSVFSLFKDISFSTEKTFFEMINLPNNFLDRLDSLK